MQYYANNTANYIFTKETQCGKSINDDDSQWKLLSEKVKDQNILLPLLLFKNIKNAFLFSNPILKIIS